MLFEQLADAQADEVEIVRAEISETEDSQLDSVAEQDMAPGMEIQAEEISEAFLEIPELKYENWEHLSPEERIDALQRMETLTAEIEHRPMAPIVGEQMGSSTYGYFSPEDGMIHINLDYLTNNSYESYCETLDTLFHEGRHAYQTFNAFSGTVVEQNDTYVEVWRANLDSDLWGYRAAQIYGFEDYYMQPVEVDARAFAEEVLDKIGLR